MIGIVLGVGLGAHSRCELMINKLYRSEMKKEVHSISNDWACGRLWLGHLPYEHGPISTGNLTVLIDGEIYGDNGPEENPENILLNLYRTGKLEAEVSRLDGSFAAAIFDASKDEIILFNDRLGTRTFFVAESPAGFIASSRPSFLLQDSLLPRRLSRQAFFEMLVFRRICSSQTLYSEIEVMPGGSLWRYKSQKFDRQKTWKMHWKSPDFSRAEAPEKFAACLVQAGRRRFGDNEKSAVLLSGGIDSRLVLAAAKGAQKPVSCLTIGPYDNREVAVARAVAKAADAPFKYVANPSEDLSETFNDAAIAAEGVHVAPFAFFRRISELTEGNDVLFSGHALDISFRGFYLPCRTLKIGKGKIRLPLLGGIKSDNLPEEMIRIWRASTPLQSLQKVIDVKFHSELHERQRQAVTYALNQTDVQNPYNALDAFAFQTQSLHYTWNDFAVMEGAIRHRSLCFDRDLFDLYLSLPPRWRAQGEIPRESLKHLNPALSNESDANTGYPLRWNGWQHIAAMVNRSAFQKLGLWSKPMLPTAMATHGSWSNLDQLLRLHPEFRERIQSLSQDPALLDTGILSEKGIEKVATEHLSGSSMHGKLLHTLLTLSAWLKLNPYSAVI